MKPVRADQRAEPTAAPGKGTSDASGALWARIWSNQNTVAALKRVESNRGAPGIDGMTVEELRPYLSALVGD